MQSLTRVFKQRRNKHMDLVSMLTEVNKVVAEEYESNSSRPEFNDKKQTPFIYSTLTSKLYLEDKKGEDQAEEDK
jgi:caspase 7